MSGLPKTEPKFVLFCPGPASRSWTLPGTAWAMRAHRLWPQRCVRAPACCGWTSAGTASHGAALHQFSTESHSQHGTPWCATCQAHAHAVQAAHGARAAQDDALSRIHSIALLGVLLARLMRMRSRQPHTVVLKEGALRAAGRRAGRWGRHCRRPGWRTWQRQIIRWAGTARDGCLRAVRWPRAAPQHPVSHGGRRACMSCTGQLVVDEAAWNALAAWQSTLSC